MDRSEHNEPAERVVLVYPTPSQLFFIIAGAVALGVLVADVIWAHIVAAALNNLLGG